MTEYRYLVSVTDFAKDSEGFRTQKLFKKESDAIKYKDKVSSTQCSATLNKLEVH